MMASITPRLMSALMKIIKEDLGWLIITRRRSRSCLPLHRVTMRMRLRLHF